MASGGPASSTSRPNVVVILVDDMGYGDFGRFNGGLSSTPTLDALMDESITLTQHYTASPVCNPSRASLMTGRYPHRTGSIDTLEWRGLERLALRERTMGDYFQGAGYATGLVGKWHLGAFDPRYHPQRRGFDEAICFRGGMHDYYQWRLEYGESIRRGDGRYLTDVWTQEACDFIDRHAREPFFLHVTYNAPHSPMQAPEDEVQPFLDKGQFTRTVATIYGMIRRMDKGVEQILDRLGRHGLGENTIVLFSSDNGPQFGGTGEGCSDRFNCNFNGYKGLTYEGGIRVPGILRWPGGGLSGGRTCNEMVHFCDWLPTLLGLAGIERPVGDPPLDGEDMLPAIRGDRRASARSRCWQWNRYTPVSTCNAAIRDGDWKLIRPMIPEAMAVPDIKWLHTSMYEPEHFITNGVIGEPDPPRTLSAPRAMELYNLAEDPCEATNLAGAHPQQVKALSDKLDQWFEDVERDRASITDVW